MCNTDIDLNTDHWDPDINKGLQMIQQGLNMISNTLPLSIDAHTFINSSMQHIIDQITAFLPPPPPITSTTTTSTHSTTTSTYTTEEDTFSLEVF
jgi:hypothetical protein